MFSNKPHNINRILDSGCCDVSVFTEATNYTFYLPKASYVQLEVSGQFNQLPGALFETSVGVDDNYSDNSRIYDISNEIYGFTGFQWSRGYYLQAGYHTIRLKAVEWAPGGTQGTVSVSRISISAITNQNGEIILK